MSRTEREQMTSAQLVLKETKFEKYKLPVLVHNEQTNNNNCTINISRQSFHTISNQPFNIQGIGYFNLTPLSTSTTSTTSTSSSLTSCYTQSVGCPFGHEPVPKYFDNNGFITSSRCLRPAKNCNNYNDKLTASLSFGIGFPCSVNGCETGYTFVNASTDNELVEGRCLKGVDNCVKINSSVHALVHNESDGNYYYKAGCEVDGCEDGFSFEKYKNTCER
eukprot:Pgem_evm1s13536